MKEGYEDNYTKRQREVENNNSFSKRVKDNMKGNVNNSVRSSKIETVSSSKGTSPLSISLYIDSPLQGNRQKSNSFFQVR